MIGLRAYLALAAVLAVGLAAWQGWQLGRDYERGEQAKALVAAQAAQVVADNARKAEEAARLAAETERDNLAQQLEDAAYAQPVDDSCGLGADRVRRLNRR